MSRARQELQSWQVHPRAAEYGSAWEQQWGTDLTWDIGETRAETKKVPFFPLHHKALKQANCKTLSLLPKPNATRGHCSWLSSWLSPARSISSLTYLLAKFNPWPLIKNKNALLKSYWCPCRLTTGFWSLSSFKLSIGLPSLSASSCLGQFHTVLTMPKRLRDRKTKQLESKPPDKLGHIEVSLTAIPERCQTVSVSQDQVFVSDWHSTTHSAQVSQSQARSHKWQGIKQSQNSQKSIMGFM